MNTLKIVRQKAEEAAKRARRDPQSIQLIAVSKGQPLEKIQEAIQAGQSDFGENYAQELLEKIAQLQKTATVRWHFLGHLQRNKVKKIVEPIEWLHALDSLSLAEQIQIKRTTPLKCLLEIKFSEEETKTGLSVKNALDLIPKLKNLDRIDLQGLMTIPPLNANPENSRPYFKKLFQLLQEINKRGLYLKMLTELSMGMSHDFEVAIEEGSTMVRVGTAIFGERK